MGGEFIFSKNDKRQRSGNTHSLRTLQWLSKRGNGFEASLAAAGLIWPLRSWRELFRGRRHYPFCSGGRALVRAVCAEGLLLALLLHQRRGLGGGGRSKAECVGETSTSPSLHLPQLKLLLNLSCIVTYLSYIRKTRSGWAASVKAILDGIRIWTLFCSSIRAKEISWHLLQYLFHKTAFTPSTVWKSSPRVRARGKSICRTACLRFQRGAHVRHMWFSYFCGHMAPGWISFIHSLSFIGWGFFSQCWDWRIKVVDFENSLTIFLYSFAIIHPFWLKVPTCVLIRASEIRKKIGKKFIFLSGGRVLSQSCSLTLPFYAWSSSLWKVAKLWKMPQVYFLKKG